MPTLPKEAYFRLVPDWVCEVLSPSTKDHLLNRKMPLYARHGVTWVWIIAPIAGILEVYVLREDGRWTLPGAYRDAVRVRAVPFEAIEIDLSALWTE
jgi:Uma2 family endonuclease